METTSNFTNTKNNNSDFREQKPAFNSIDFVAHVNRLSVSESKWKGIYLYGFDNNYPNKIIEIAKRSNSLMTAINTQAKFIQGQGFPGATPLDAISGNSIKLNRNNLTAYDLLKYCAISKSFINIAIHVNYNKLGEAVEFTPIKYEFVRKKLPIDKDLFTKYIITNIWNIENKLNVYGFNSFLIQDFYDWVNKSNKQDVIQALEVFEYNPDPIVVREQIKMSGGIENYPGQIFYRNDSFDIYQLAIFDSVIDDAQIESESKLYSISNLQNGFSSSGVFKYFQNMDSNEEFNELRQKLKNTTGAINAGRMIVMPFLPAQDMPTNVYEPIQLQNIDSLFEKQKEEAKNNINQRFNIPNALIGKDSSGNFATQRVQEHFDFYNAITETLRQNLEIDLNVLLSNSIYKDAFQFPIQINALEYGNKNIKPDANIN